MKRFIMAALVAATLAIGLAGGATATQGEDHKVGICHRTASDSNPYVYIEVDVASLDAHLNNLPGHPAKTNEDGSPRNDYLYTEETPCTLFDSSPEPSTEPSPSTSPEPTSSPSPSPTSSPSSTPAPTTPTPTSSPSITLPPTDTDSSGSSGGANEGILFAIGFLLFVTSAAMWLSDQRDQSAINRRR